MSFKYQAQKITPNHWVLPKCADMKVEVHAFLSEKLYQASEENMWNQIAESASYEGVIGAYLLPDCHVGYGIPIGGVIVTDNTIIQSGSGFDINCGCLYLKVPGLTAEDIASHKKRDSWVREIGKHIAFGNNHDRPKYMPDFSENDIQEMLRFGAKPLGVKADVCEKQFIPIPDNTDLTSIEKAWEKAKIQLGSIGGSNHFLEMQVDEADGSVWVMIHCGSRGYGYQTADEFFYRGAEARGLSKEQRKKSFLYTDETVGKDYWAHHNSAANFAIANRHVIVEGVNKALRKIFKAEGEVFYEISHNLVQSETLVLPDGSTKKGLVHRKGSTRAFPAGHPDLVGTKWEATGHPACIPGSMRDGAAILTPLQGAYKSGCSVNHGAGRKIGRREAKRKLSHKQQYIEEEMATITRKLGGTTVRGIVRNQNKVSVDESAYAYKNLDDVLAVLEDEGIAKIDRRLFPVANMKG